MSEINFYKPQRESKIGILLIFFATLYHLVRNFWVLGVYFLIQDTNPRFLFFAVLGLGMVLFLALIYSIFYYLKFVFFIDEEKKAFVLQKGVFSSDVVTVPFHKIQQVNFNRNILQNILGVYSVVIDTAGSQEKEVEIKALSKKKADMLSELLMEHSSKEPGNEPEIHPEEEKGNPRATETPAAQWEYKLSISTLLKIGFTSNYLRGLAILLAFYFNFKSQLDNSAFTNSEELPFNVPEVAISEFATSTLFFLFLVFMVLLITVGETFIKYFGLHLKKNTAGLQVEMGLKNNTKVNLRATRVQLMEETTNPLQQRLDLYKLKISLSSSQDALEKNQIKIPGLPKMVVHKVKNYVYDSEIKREFDILPNKILLSRNIFLSFFPLIIGLMIYFLSDLNFSIAWVGSAVLSYIVLTVVYHIFYFKTIKLSVSEEFLIKKGGIWNRKKQFLEMYKLQSVSVSQALWYKKRNLVNLTFHSAGGDISYRLVNKDEVQPLVNYLLYKIEATPKAWM